MNRKLLIILVILYLFGAFLHLGRLHFSAEEPRRSIIALEMNYTHNYLTPQVLGKTYFKKPPLHNIAIAISFELFGANEFAARLVSVLSMIIFSVIIFFVTKNILDFDSAAFAGFSFALAFVTYFKYGITAETDMFFSLLVFISLILIFYNKIFIGSIFTALALLTKGFPALHYFYLTLLTYAIIKKDLKKTIFSKETILGFVFILTIFVGWLLLASNNNLSTTKNFLNFITKASFGRVISVKKIADTIIHAIHFPIKFWYNFFPFSILILLFINKSFLESFKKTLRSNKKIKEISLFSTAAFIPNFLIYAIIPDGRVRYALAIFGILAIFLGIVYHQLQHLETEKKKYFNLKRPIYWIFYTEIALLIFAVYFDLSYIKTNDYLISMFDIILCIIGIYLVKKLTTNIHSLFVGLVLFGITLKLFFISVGLSYLNTYTTHYRIYAAKIYRIIQKEKPKYIMTNGKNLKLFFYLEKDLNTQFHPIVPQKKGLIISASKRFRGKLVAKIVVPDKSVGHVMERFFMDLMHKKRLYGKTTYYIIERK